MNYSVFKFQQQGGKPGIFWEKDSIGFPTVPLYLPHIESIPKKDRKFGYKTKNQRFPPRRFPGDDHHVETDLVSLSPNTPPPPPKPAKNFIKRNKQKVTPVTEKQKNGTVTLTQEQLNAILRSVGKVAGGSENAVKISIDKSKNKDEILVESPRRRDDYSDDEDYNDRREKRRPKKKAEAKEEEVGSIYSLLDSKPSKGKASSDNEDQDSDVSLQLITDPKPRRRRRERKSRKQDIDDRDDDRESKSRKNMTRGGYDIEAEIEKLREKNRRNRSKHRDRDDEDDDVGDRHRRNRSKHRDHDDDEDDVRDKHRRNRSKHRDNDEDDYDDNRKRRSRSLKRRDDSDNEYDDNREYERRERTRKSEKEKVRKDDNYKEKREKRERKESHEREVNNERDSSLTKDPEEVPSPRDKIGLPTDLSWRHMTKAERRRLEMARQRFLDEEERREEDRIKRMNPRFEPSPFKKAPPRSDPVTRATKYEHRGRETENSNHTDGYRRDRRSRSPEPEESRSRTPEQTPDVPSHHSPESSPKGQIGLPRRHMTLAEKKKQEWERERVESVQLQRVGDFDPWGRPGAGAPLRTRSGHVMAEYKGRQENVRTSTIREEETEQTVKEDDSVPPAAHTDRKHRKYSPPPQPSALHHQDQQDVPHAMRSSFVFGQGAPDRDRFVSAKERERRQWLADLEKQIEDKKMKEMKNKEAKEENTWADKLGQSHRPMAFPEQPKDTVSGAGDPFSINAEPAGLDTNRVNSAPQGIQNDDDDNTHIRGQNAPIDPVTKREWEQKRQRYLEHQEAIKAQVEEKERLKRMEREKKIKEDLEEERKLQADRDLLKSQFEQEQQKTKQKEQQRQNQVNQLKAAMDEAQAKALQEKYQRKMQHLEAGGHDTKKLREHLEGEITSRIELLHTRRERDIQRAQQILQLQQWGLAQTVEEEPPPEPSPPPQLTAKITPRTEHGDMVSVAPSYVPGLDLSTTRTAAPQQPVFSRREYGHDTTHDPYTEDRVLTPSRFRQPSKPWSDPSSPRREFGTQTGKLNDSATELDGEEIAHLLNRGLTKEDTEVNIEYRVERGKKVRVISAPKEIMEKRRKARESPGRRARDSPGPPTYREQPSPHQHHHDVRKQREKEEQQRKKKLELQRRKGPVKVGSRPMWGYKNADNKRAAKQSERDPFYERKKRESEMRRLKREQKLLAMVQANKDVIPDYYVPPPKSRSHSRDRSPFSDVAVKSPREVKVDQRSQSHSPHRYGLEATTDYLAVHDTHNDVRTTRRQHQSKSPQRYRAESPEGPSRTSERTGRSRVKSPPVPAIRHRNDVNQSNINDASNDKRKGGGKYKDADPLDIPVQNGEFVPFTRTIEVLDPLKAEEPLPLSREATRIANARKAYYESLHPEKFGNQQNVYQDKQRIPKGPEDLKNPLMNPSLVTEHPTNRQDQILLQLSTLKQSLMQRQRELETFSPTDLEKQDTMVH